MTQRLLSSHKVNPANDKLRIEVLDEPGQGNACHNYRISGFDTTNNPSEELGQTQGVEILFQNGPIAEFGVNGVTQEALLAIVEDRLIGFQQGPYACSDNQTALYHVQSAMQWLQKRTRDRMARGVEGTHIV